MKIVIISSDQPSRAYNIFLSHVKGMLKQKLIKRVVARNTSRKIFIDGQTQLIFVGVSIDRIRGIRFHGFVSFRFFNNSKRYALPKDKEIKDYAKSVLEYLHIEDRLFLEHQHKEEYVIMKIITKFMNQKKPKMEGCEDCDHFRPDTRSCAFILNPVPPPYGRECVGFIEKYNA